MAESTLKELKAIFDCQICNRQLDVPVFMCENGHSVCNSCRVTQASCPECFANWTDRRNAKLEKIMEKIFMKNCKHRGCQVRKMPEELKIHESECDRRKIGCFYCPRSIVANEYSNHLESARHNPFSLNVGETNKVCEVKFLLGGSDSEFLKDGQKFFLAKSSGLFAMNLVTKKIIYTTLSPSQAKQFSYAMKIEFQDGKVMVFEEKVRSIEEPGTSKLVLASDSGMWLPTLFFNREPYKNAKLTVEISKCQ